MCQLPYGKKSDLLFPAANNELDSGNKPNQAHAEISLFQSAFAARALSNCYCLNNHLNYFTDAIVSWNLYIFSQR